MGINYIQLHFLQLQHYFFYFLSDRFTSKMSFVQCSLQNGLFQHVSLKVVWLRNRSLSYMQMKFLGEKIACCFVIFFKKIGMVV